MKLIEIAAEKEYCLLPDYIWDGLSDDIFENKMIFVKDGHINKITTVPNQLDKLNGPAELLRLPGITLIPGLIDCHIHFAMNSNSLAEAITAWEQRPDQIQAQIRQAAQSYLQSGIVAVRDGGDKMNIGLQTRHDILHGVFPGPMVTATGQAIYCKGKYGNFLGPGIESVDEAKSQIRGLKNKGIDQLKVISSGIVSFKNFGLVGPVQFLLKELRPIVEYAHENNLNVMAHASSPEAIEIAVMAGVESIEHGYFIKPKLMDLMAEKGTAWIPTLAPLGNLVNGQHLPYTGANMEVIKRSFDLQLISVKEAHHRGVKLGVGTDAGANCVPHGISYHDELNYYATAGLKNATILKTATSSSAKIIGQEKALGSISAGKIPRLIGVIGNPLKSLEILKKPVLLVSPANCPAPILQ